MKYIMMETAEGKRLPFIFPESMVHAYVALMAKELIAITTKAPATCVSAGFVTGIGLDVTTHGTSESLGVDSDPADAAYIALGEAVAMMPPLRRCRTYWPKQGSTSRNDPQTEKTTTRPATSVLHPLCAQLVQRRHDHGQTRGPMVLHFAVGAIVGATAVTRKQKRQRRARVRQLHQKRIGQRYRQTREAFNYFKWYMGIR